MNGVVYFEAFSGHRNETGNLNDGADGYELFRVGNLAPPVTAPEIAVEQPLNTDLTDDSGDIDFGAVIVNTPSAAKTFTIRNTGTANLTGLVVNKDGANPGDFAVGALGSTTVAPGGFTTFTVTFTPGAAGPRGAKLHIESNDANENTFDIELKGSGAVAPTLSATLSGGTLTIADIDATGKDNNLSISVSGGNLIISDANETFVAAPPRLRPAPSATATRRSPYRSARSRSA